MIRHLNLRHRRRQMVPRFVSQHCGYANRRVATWEWRFCYSYVAAGGAA